jgi:hypothetical protein
MPAPRHRLRFLLFRQALRSFRRGVSASTPFIGAPRNNFSHSFKKLCNACLSGSATACATALHTLSQSAANAVRISISRCPIAVQPTVSIRCSPPRMAAVGQRCFAMAPPKKRRQEEAGCPIHSRFFANGWEATNLKTPYRYSRLFATKKNGGKRIAPCRHRFCLSTVFALCL